MAPQVSSQAIDVFRAYSTEPAPMGIADYGVGPAGPYQYSTTAFLGSVYMASLQTRNATGDHSMGFQLNVVLAFADINVQYAYWVQDVAQIDTSTNQIFFIDNIWNFTSHSANMVGSAVSGNGQVATYHGTGYYYDVPAAGAGNGINLAYPATVSFLVTTGFNSNRQPTVKFQYEDGVGIQTYDNVTFKTAIHVSALTGFEVNGNSYDPAGTYFDSELVLGGPGGGLSTADVNSDLRLSLYYWNGHNFQTVPNTYNFGSDTAETISSVASLGNYVLATGSLISQVQAGAGSLGQLYTLSGTGTIAIQTPVGSGTLFVSNSTFPNATPFQTQFTGSQVTVSVHPGVYLLQIYLNGAIYDSGTVTVGSGQTLQLRTPLGDIQITMSYIAGGGGRFPAPTITYVHGGSTQTSALTTTATIYYLDPGTSWTVTGNFTTTNERWQTQQPVSGKATSFQTVIIDYFHQYHVSFAFAVIGGGTGYSAPSVRFLQFGAYKTVATDTVVWVDEGSSYSYPNTLIGSAASERWEASSYTGVASGPGTIKTTYFHLYGLSVTFIIVGGGSPSNPAIDAKQFGLSFVAILSPGPNTYFLDAWSNWSIQNPLQGSSAQERWNADGPTTINLTSVETITLDYHHQYPVSTNVSPQSGGSISNLTGWHDQGTSLQLSATVNPGWKFEGWNGSGTGAYTGASNTTSLVVGSPIQENATFYPGLKMVAGSNGQVSYSFGSTSGTVQAGTAVMVFAPAGIAVVLKASPSSIFYVFSGWSLGNGGTGSTTNLTLMSPSTAQASFAFNTPLLSGLVAAILVVVLVSAFALRSRRRSVAGESPSFQRSFVLTSDDDLAYRRSVRNMSLVLAAIVITVFAAIFVPPFVYPVHNVFQSSVSGDSPFGFTLHLRINATTVSHAGTIMLTGWVNSTSSSIENVTASNSWAIPQGRLWGRICTTGWPIGLGVMKGHYTQDNYTSGTVIPFPQPLASCPVQLSPPRYFLFEAHSSNALVTIGGNTVTWRIQTEFSFSGFQNSAQQSGVYTAVISDEWGDVLTTNFLVT